MLPLIRSGKHFAKTNSATPKCALRALWRPAWYELDQSLEIDDEDDYAFCKAKPSNVPATYELVFHNPLLDQSEPIVHRARIVGIHHPVFGAVRRVDAKGLVYEITLVDGTAVHVEAEETPGRIEYISGQKIANIASWDLEVGLLVANV